MKKLLTLVSAFALVFTSCSSDDSPSMPSTVGIKLTQMIETYDDGTVETITITYNGDKIVSSSSDLDIQDETIFTYTGDLITKEEYFFDDGDPLEVFNEVTEYEYDTSGRLINSTRTENDYYGTFITVDDFTYNTNGTVTFTTTKNSGLYATGTIYFNGNQPYKKEVTEEVGTLDEFSWVEETFFDDKVNPLNSVIGLSKTQIACPTYIRGYPGALNNQIEVKIDNVTEWSTSYTYNSNDMPATDIYTDTSNSDYNSTSQYIYN